MPTLFTQQDIDALAAKNGHREAREKRESTTDDGANFLVVHGEGSGPFGGRDNACYSYCGWLWYKRVPLSMALFMAHAWNEEFCKPPLPYESVEEKVKRAFAEANVAFWEQEAVREEDVKRQEPQAERTYELLTIDELLDLPKEEQKKWLVPNVLKKAGLHFLSAPGAGAKSWVMMELARCIVSGQKWFGRYDVEQGPVLYVDEEMGKDMAKERAEKLGIPRGCPFYYLGLNEIRIDDPRDLAYLCVLCREKKISLVCIDTLTGVRPGLQENESAHVSALRACFRQILKTGASILVAHHDRKMGEGEGNAKHYRMAGSRDLGAMGDMAFGIDNKDSFFHLGVSKNRLVKKQDEISLNFSVDDVTDKDGNVSTILRVLDLQEVSNLSLSTVENRILETLAESGGLNVSTIIKEVTGSSAAIVAALDRLEQRGAVSCRKVANAKFYNLPDEDDPAAAPPDSLFPSSLS